MARTFTKKTAEDRRAEAEALHESIAAQVETLRDSDAWRAFLDFARSFHRYSLNNLLLILSQRPTATRVAGFRQWQAKGRQVRKGEKGLRIFGYAQKKVTDAETGEEEKVTYFPMLSVFDIDQTDPIEGTDDPTELVQRLTGDDPRGILAAVTDILEARGWTVRHEVIPGDANGYATMDGSCVVVIDSNLSPAHAAKTALHEAAHVLLHAEDEDHAGDDRATGEVEAESVAYVVAGLLGMDTAAYSIGYVAGWSDADPEVIRSTAARVLAAAHTLVEAITPAVDAEPVAA